MDTRKRKCPRSIMRKVRLCLRPHKLLAVAAVVTGLILVWTSLCHERTRSIVTGENNMEIQVPFSRAVRQKNTKVSPGAYNISEKLTELAKFIYKAKKHVRGVKTADSLKRAINTLEEILAHLNIDTSPLKERPKVRAKSVCPEEFKGTTYGYPYFYKGFEVTDCVYGKPVSDLLTITAYIKPNTGHNVEAAVERFLASVYQQSPVYRTIVAAEIAPSSAAKFVKQFPNLEMKDSSAIQGWSAGKIWNNLVQSVNTEYVFIARNVEVITNDTRFDRLIREIESLDLVVAAGAFRTPNGHWSNGCYQMAYKNYSLSYFHGYDESQHECLFCDYVEGPFISARKFLDISNFKNLDETNGLFEDWFLSFTKQEQHVAVCPDSMFHTDYNAHASKNWDSFMKRWDLYHFRSPTGITVMSPCNKRSDFVKARAVSACALNNIAKALKFLMSSCEEADIICELQEGTALGAVKFNKILPWERDADVTFLTANYSAFQNLKNTFKTLGYGLVDLKALRCCVDNRTAGGKFKLHVPGWHVELYGQHKMDTELLIAEGQKPTKVLLDGQWVNVPRNPGLFMRNRYGHEIYRHALHWQTLREKSGWVNYKTTKFLTCERPGHHACMDRYNTDGNLQFEMILP